jgi:hypothetical protein
MIIDLISLIFLVIVNILLITSIFNFTRANTKDTTSNTLIIDISELITLVFIIPFTLNYVLYKKMDGASLLLLSIIALSLIIVIWGIFRVPMIRDFLGIKVGIDRPSANNNLLNNIVNNTNNVNNSNNVNSVNNKNHVIFSKYATKNNRNNFSFSNLFPSYNDEQKNQSVKDSVTDYSQFNSYPDGHICQGCSCMEDEYGKTFCGKYISGMGTIGCSCRWECMNCKGCGEHKCDASPVTDSVYNDEDYECENCKCHDTDAGIICGKIDRTNGYVHKCKSSCRRCDKCYGANTSDLLGNKGMITVDPVTNLNKVIIYDLADKDLEKLL